jgi:hypothetical protein
MRRLAGPAVLALSSVLAAGCATMTVSSHVQPGLDVARYHTYEWGPPDALPTGDARLDKNPFFQDHMMGAVEKQLARLGYQQATTTPPDLLIHYHANIAQRIDVNRLDREFGYCRDGDCDARVTEYENGTLIVDVMDARTNQLVWRGWAQANVDAVIGHPDRLRRMINDAVERMLVKFPRQL